MSKLRQLEDFQADIKNMYDFLNETGQDKAIQIIDPEQELAWFGHSLERLQNWIQFAIDEEHEREDEALPDEGDRVMARVGE